MATAIIFRAEKGIVLAFLFFFFFISGCKGKQSINRKALVGRHFPSVTKPDSLSPFTAGNGEFAFTADITGLQTFPDYYKNGIPLGTLSQWCWHSAPNKNGFKLDQAYKYFDSCERKIPYASNQQPEAAGWLRANPHRLHMGQIGFRLLKNVGSKAEMNDLSGIRQTLNLWQGIIKSYFMLEGEKIAVETAVQPDQDRIAAKIQSENLGKGLAGIEFKFSYGSESWGKESADWAKPEKHSSEIIESLTSSVLIKRTLDSTTYYVRIQWKGSAVLSRTDKHDFYLSINERKKFEFSASFSPDPIRSDLTPVDVFRKSSGHWKNFWKSGGAIDLSGSTDPRANELERRIILSQYLTAVQCAGSLPPQETGLTYNSWYGKFHLEMHWWHAVHFALWGRKDLLEKSLGWYKKILPVAEQTARLQGYSGVRWPKMTDPDGRESPSGVGVFLIWQQPHPIYYAELLFMVTKDPDILNKYSELVFQTAEFMASYTCRVEQGNRYNLGPPLIPAQEIYKPGSTFNPPFELSYWHFGLKTAQLWRERLGMARVEKWDQILENLSEFPEKCGLYINAENATETFTDPWHRNDHPTVLGAFGMLPNDKIDIEKMRGTLKKVMESWNWQRTWGWDYPLVAMTAARVGEPEIAIDALLMNVQKNTYLNNGHNFQDQRLTIYLPGNGGLLSAVAMMAAGWEGAPELPAPGFPKNGEWIVKVERIHRMP